MKKFLASDLDGTLIYDFSFKKSDLQAIHRFRREGGFFSLCTGRPLNWTVPLFDLDTLECDAMILGNGASAYMVDSINPLSFTEIFDNQISYSLGLEIINFFYSLEEFVLYWSDGKTTYELSDRRFPGGYSIVQDGLSQFVTIDELNKHPMLFSNICLVPAVPNMEKMERILLLVQEQWGRDVEIFRNQCFLDVCPKNSSKGLGICQLTEFLSEPFELYAVGDSWNDLTMFEYVGRDNAFIMQNADDKLKNKGYRVVKSVHECIEQILWH